MAFQNSVWNFDRFTEGVPDLSYMFAGSKGTTGTIERRSDTPSRVSKLENAKLKISKFNLKYTRLASALQSDSSSNQSNDNEAHISLDSSSDEISQKRTTLKKKTSQNSDFKSSDLIEGSSIRLVNPSASNQVVNRPTDSKTLELEDVEQEPQSDPVISAREVQKIRSASSLESIDSISENQTVLSVETAQVSTTNESSSNSSSPSALANIRSVKELYDTPTHFNERKPTGYMKPDKQDDSGDSTSASSISTESVAASTDTSPVDRKSNPGRILAKVNEYESIHSSSGKILRESNFLPNNHSSESNRQISSNSRGSDYGDHFITDATGTSNAGASKVTSNQLLKLKPNVLPNQNCVCIGVQTVISRQNQKSRKIQVSFSTESSDVSSASSYKLEREIPEGILRTQLPHMWNQNENVTPKEPAVDFGNGSDGGTINSRSMSMVLSRQLYIIQKLLECEHIRYQKCCRNVRSLEEGFAPETLQSTIKYLRLKRGRRKKRNFLQNDSYQES